MPNNFSFVLDKAKAAFGDRPIFENTRLPLTPINGQHGSGPSYVTVPALWTRDGFRPQWKNLAVIASSLENTEDLNRWNHILVGLGIPLGIFVVDGSFFLTSSVGIGQSQVERVERDDLSKRLTQRNPSLFTPKALSTFRSGQLSFADVEEGVTRESFSFHLRYHASLARSLENAIAGAFRAELEAQTRQRRGSAEEPTSVFDSVLIVTIAFLAARILEDKGFFGPQQLPSDNVQALLEQTVTRLNGFFEKALYKELPRVSDEALQQLSIELGSRAIFTLIDHHDVARLYEEAIRTPLEIPEVDLAAFQTPLLDLQQYYTPVAVAERMLDSLPLERIRPEERRIFDPAAGSGTLLLAASRRLASMSDLPFDHRAYLTTQVAGNDLDPNANLLTRIRYTLSQETVGASLPAPAHFSSDDYESYTKDSLVNHPRIIVANPPFGQQDRVQRATRFLNLVTEWLGDGDQFAVILPNTFLTGSTQGAKQARRQLAERCQMFEVWTLPESVVGVRARQAVCVLLGCIGKGRHVPTVVRSTISSAMAEVAREEGFLAETWMAEVGEGAAEWKTLVAPPIPIPPQSVRLADIYYVFTGVTTSKHYPPVAEPPEGVETKKYWKVGWKHMDRIWADPANVPPEEKYVRYGREYLRRPILKNSHLLDMPKVLVGRSVNRNAVDPLAACLDTTGFCPNVDVHCITTWEAKGQPIDEEKTPVNWQQLTGEEKLLWLVGILTSELACEISLTGRSARHLESPQLKDFPLPNAVDGRIISVAREMLERDQRREALPTPDPLRVRLNELVEAAYGNPHRIKLLRTGVDTAYETSQAEATTSSIVVTGQVRDVSQLRGQILLWLQGINDDADEAWLPVPPDLPGWALSGDIFTADLSDDIETFSQIVERPRALRNFRHTPRPYLTIEELKKGFASSN
jgi:hypothetical protein